ncbi:MAG: cysteine hydrolase family protein [Anaerolineae bacterium]
MTDQTALLIIDVQQGMIDEKPYRPDELIAHLQTVIEKAHAADVPVIYVKHAARDPQDSLHPDNAGHAIVAAIAPQPGELVVTKHNPDSFQDTVLQQELEARGIKKLIIAGMQSEMCVDTTTRAAFSRGYDVTLVSDAHSTFDNGILSAPDIIKHHNRTLRDFADTKSSDEVQFA